MCIRSVNMAEWGPSVRSNQGGQQPQPKRQWGLSVRLHLLVVVVVYAGDVSLMTDSGSDCLIRFSFTVLLLAMGMLTLVLAMVTVVIMMARTMEIQRDSSSQLVLPVVRVQHL